MVNDSSIWDTVFVNIKHAAPASWRASLDPHTRSDEWEWWLEVERFYSRVKLGGKKSHFYYFLYSPNCLTQFATSLQLKVNNHKRHAARAEISPFNIPPLILHLYWVQKNIPTKSWWCLNFTVESCRATTLYQSGTAVCGVCPCGKHKTWQRLLCRAWRQVSGYTVGF